MRSTCRITKEEFEVTGEDLDFYDRVSPQFGKKRIQIPPPSLGPQGRWIRRMAFRNERKLYRRQCDLTGKEIISTFAPDTPYTVYDQEAWWSDRWEGLQYGRDYDFSKTFTEQFSLLSREVPHESLYVRNVENSYYGNHILNTKNCYLLFGGADSEDCQYSRFLVACRDVLDGLSLYNCELCYEGIASQSCYDCHFFKNCQDCNSCYFVEDCRSCSNCLLCFGLYRKEYYVLNTYVGKEAFEKYKSALFPLTHAKIAEYRSHLNELSLSLPHRASHIYASENCTGDMIFNSKDCFHCFDINNCEDCKYVSFTPNGVASYDCTYSAPEGTQYSLENCSSLCSRSIGTFMCWSCDSAFYSLECHHCKNIFGCVGLRNKEYCIFNKQYTKDQYHELAAKIAESMIQTAEWGEFLSPELSCFAYNQSVAAEYYPFTREQALRHGFSWRDETEKAQLPKKEQPVLERIDQVDDSILRKELSCKNTGRAFRINQRELSYYRRTGLPIPEICPDERHRIRTERRNPRKVWKRQCAKTGEEIWTTYSPERPEIVYSEAAYREEQ